MPDATSALDDLPLVAILRGLRPTEADAVGDGLVEAGIQIIEVPLNSPQPLDSIGRLARRLGEDCLIGAGTVLDPADVDRVADVGGRLIVTPNCAPTVIGRAIALDMVVMPGIATATEAFAAVGAGARHLKLFPASTYGASHLKALSAVLPADVRIYAVGGVGASDMAVWRAAGAAGFGIGSELFRPGDAPAEVRERARSLVAAFRAVG
jgi:2-dehydro-3-deoxyphosphogalactonate aldolase